MSRIGELYRAGNTFLFPFWAWLDITSGCLLVSEMRQLKNYRAGTSISVLLYPDSTAVFFMALDNTRHPWAGKAWEMVTRFTFFQKS